jgi:type I restriction enzyme, R subunit
MTEAALVERPILDWLCGKTKPGGSAGGLGWTYRDEAAMAAFDRPLQDPLVEDLLIPALMRINSEIKTIGQAKLAIGALRTTMSHPDKLTANRQTLDLLRDGARVVLNPERMRGLFSLSLSKLTGRS